MIPAALRALEDLLGQGRLSRSNGTHEADLGSIAARFTSFRADSLHMRPYHLIVGLCLS